MEILDATLREGEQRAGRSYTVDQKVAAAERLDDLGVDYIQVGFPIADDGTGEAAARLDTAAAITGIARALDRDIDAAADAGVDLVEVSAPTSDLQRERLLGVDREGLIAMIHDALDHARDTGLDVHFGAMDGFRTDPGFVRELLADLDVPYVGIADTVGVRTPDEVAAFLDALGGDLERVSVHFHADLGVGTANALAAVRMGAGKVDVTAGGVGERAGNVALEELVVANALAEDPVPTDVDEARLIPLVSAVLDALDEDVPPHKPILGETAFQHESGMHTAAMLDDPATFEPFDPARFGGARDLRFGPHSGAGAARRLLERAGVEPTEDRTSRLLSRLHGLDAHVTLDEALSLAGTVGSD